MSASYPVKGSDGRHLGSVIHLANGWTWIARLGDGRYSSRGRTKTKHEAEDAIRAAHQAAERRAQ